MTSIKENLIAAKALIDTQEKWGKGYDGNCIFYATTTATEFGDAHDVEQALRASLPDHLGHRRLSHFNDHPDTTHADVMALFDRAIEAQP